MIKLYHASQSRSIRVCWLLEELGLPYQVEPLAFTADSLKSPAYLQVHPLGKVPSIQDGELIMFESGAIVEYIVENYGHGRLAPALGSPQRGPFLQWVHFAEATAMPPLSDIVAHTMAKPEAERIPAVVADAQGRFAAVRQVWEHALAGKQYLLGNDFSAADIMTGYPLLLAKYMGLLDRCPQVIDYFERLQRRPAFQKALTV